MTNDENHLLNDTDNQFSNMLKLDPSVQNLIQDELSLTDIQTLNPPFKKKGDKSKIRFTT